MVTPVSEKAAHLCIDHHKAPQIASGLCPAGDGPGVSVCVWSIVNHVNTLKKTVTVCLSRATGHLSASKLVREEIKHFTYVVSRSKVSNLKCQSFLSS